MYQLVIVSPELLLNDKRFEMLRGKKQFTDDIVNLVLDEAHVIKEWGGTFRTDYLKIGPIRDLFPRMIGFHLGSATIGPALLPELAKNLHLQTDNLSVMRLNTDRPNIHLVVHRMQHPLNSYEDLMFIIKKNLGPGVDLHPAVFQRGSTDLERPLGFSLPSG
jgi:superfamily II DNA helicase RecQ